MKYASFWLVFVLYYYGVEGFAISASDDHQLLLKADEVELYKTENDNDSWLKMVLIFSKRNSTATVSTNSTNSTIGNSTSECLTDFKRLGDNCYYFSSTTANWYNATKICHLLGANLAHPLNSTENSLIQNYLSKNLHGWWWIGGTDEAEEGKWIWAQSQTAINFTNWADHMPDNDGGIEDCLSLWENYSWKWNDGNCLLPNYFICQQ